MGWPKGLIIFKNVWVIYLNGFCFREDSGMLYNNNAQENFQDTLICETVLK